MIPLTKNHQVYPMNMTDAQWEIILSATAL